MHPHSRGRAGSTGETATEVEPGPRRASWILPYLGALATFVVAMLALSAMRNPALADPSACVRLADPPSVRDCP